VVASDCVVPYRRMSGALDGGHPPGRIGDARMSSEFGGGQPVRSPPGAYEVVPLFGVEDEHTQRWEGGEGVKVGDACLAEVQSQEIRQARERGNTDRSVLPAGVR
jgi:hypothetical protein